jgi:hypothetical protein
MTRAQGKFIEGYGNAIKLLSQSPDFQVGIHMVVVVKSA